MNKCIVLGLWGRVPELALAPGGCGSVREVVVPDATLSPVSLTGGVDVDGFLNAG